MTLNTEPSLITSTNEETNSLIMNEIKKLSEATKTMQLTAFEPTSTTKKTTNCNNNNNGMVTNGEKPIVYKLVLTGGPCSGKTTGQARISTFFENIGWKVYRVPETATTLFSGGVRFAELDQQQCDKFQENLMRTMLAIEATYFDLAVNSNCNCLVICDRGLMDARAYMSNEIYEKICNENNWNTIDLRDNRYDQVVHLMTAAFGAESFYSLDNNPCRSEGLEHARQLDRMTSQAWLGHPYFDVIDNSTDFEAKVKRLISSVCRRIGVDTGDRLMKGAKKYRFTVSIKNDDDNNNVMPSYQEFDVVHHYLVSSNPDVQFRVRKRGQNNKYYYTHTTRRLEENGQRVESRRQIDRKEYLNYLETKDEKRYVIQKKRRCFLSNDMYFQLDYYLPPCHERCHNLLLLETYSTQSIDYVITKIPNFLKLEKDVTQDASYSMFNLSLKAEWNSDNFETTFCNGNGYDYKYQNYNFDTYHRFSIIFQKIIDT